MRKALRRVLRAAGHQVEAFGSVAEWYQLNHRKVGACLILDVGLPGLSGLDLQKRLITSGWRVPIIFLTASDEERLREEALRDGAVAFFLKPLDPAILLEGVRRALRASAKTDTSVPRP